MLPYRLIYQRGLLIILLVIFAACSPKLSFHNVDITGADYAQGFALKDMNGQDRTLKDYAGKVVLVFFGYTQCPDVCPTTMADMVSVMQALGADADKLQVLFVTVDPLRDTPELLKQYVPSFDKRFMGMYADTETIDKTTRDFKVYYGKVPGATASTYTIDHTAASYVFDKEGKIRLFVRNGQGVAPLVEDLKKLIQL